MISLALGVILASNSLPQAQNQLFEKIAELSSPVLNDRELFSYLKEGKQALAQINATDSFGRFGTYVLYKEQPPATLKPNAPKLKVGLFVFERVFLSPEQASSIESRDKQRLLLALNRVRTMFINLHNGELDLEIIPKFYTEPVLRAEEMTNLVDHELNDSVFETEDREERGPFAAVLKLSAVGTKDFDSAFELGANRPDAKLEYRLLQSILRGIDQSAHQRYGTETVSNPGAILSELRFGPNEKVLDPRASLTPSQIEPIFQQGGKVLEEGTLEKQFDFVIANRTAVTGLDKFEGTLRYYEQSVTRSGGFLVPLTQEFLEQKTPKSIEFEVRANTFNNIRISFSDGKGFNMGPNTAAIDLKQGEWKKVSIPVPTDTKFVQIGSDEEGSMRLRTELVVYQFRNFVLNYGAAATPQPPKFTIPAPDQFATALEQASSLPEQRRLAQYLRNSSLDMRSNLAFRKALLDYTNSIDPFVAYWSTEAFGRLCFTPTNAEDQTLAANYLKTPPNEFARAAALEWVAKWPELSNFEGISPNAVRVSWRTRLAAVQALAGQDKSNAKSKPAARQMLYTTTMQETAWIRKEALLNLKWIDPDERKRLEYASVNEPCEPVRFAIFRQISGASSSLSPELASSVLADDSPTYRIRVANSLAGSSMTGARDLLRRMIVDIDPRVRAAALKSILSFADANNAEFQNLFADKSIVVQLVLAESFAAGKLKLPVEVKESLSKSPSLAVRKLLGAGQ